MIIQFSVTCFFGIKNNHDQILILRKLLLKKKTWFLTDPLYIVPVSIVNNAIIKHKNIWDIYYLFVCKLHFK